LDLFESDVDEVIGKLRGELSREEYAKVMRLRDDLLRLHGRNVVKINHSIMELICAKYLIQGGFEVELEHTLNGFSCDLYATKGLGSLIVPPGACPRPSELPPGPHRQQDHPLQRLREQVLSRHPAPLHHTDPSGPD